MDHHHLRPDPSSPSLVRLLPFSSTEALYAVPSIPPAFPPALPSAEEGPEEGNLQRHWYLLIFVLVPLACIVGNSLVIAAVWTTRGLQTPTNYLLVSLACADLIVGALVMPFSIYQAVNGHHWHLPAEVCHFYCVLDVAASTASIVNLVLISMDRLVAATRPADYKSPKHKRRVYAAIGFTWIFSVSLSLPLVTGFNTKTRYFLLHEHHCGIYSPIYMLCSSIFAFYLPCIIMLVTYGYIFHVLRRRLRTIQLQEMAGGQFLGFGADVGNIATSAMETVKGVEQRMRGMISWEKPLLKKIEETAAEHASSLNESEREQLMTILETIQQPRRRSSEGDSLADSLVASPQCSSEHYARSGRRGRGLGVIFEADGRSTPMSIADAPPPSIVLDAITQKPPSYHSGSLTSFSSSLHRGSSTNAAQHLCVNLPSTRRFSEVLHSTLEKSERSLSVLVGEVGGSGEGDGDGEGRTQRNARRHSYHPEGVKEKERSRERHRLLDANKRRKSMRRLSEMISGWDPPSRTSITQMYTFARRESVYIARRKLAGLKDWALDLLAKLKSNQGIAIRRETRATKLVATVLCVFLICWLPFFTLNMIKVYRLIEGDWPKELEILFHWFGTLGYVNSSVNFFVYAAINKKFRSSFRRLVGLKRSNANDKTWMLPPKEKRPKRRQRPHRQHHHHHSSDQQNKASDSSPISKEELKAVSADCGANTATDEPRSQRRSSAKRRSIAGTTLNILNRHFSFKRPKIVIDGASLEPTQEKISISMGGNTTYRRSSDDAIQRSSSEVLGGGVVFPNTNDSRRGSDMSNSSASLQLHDMHQIQGQSCQETEIFV